MGRLLEAVGESAAVVVDDENDDGCGGVVSVRVAPRCVTFVESCVPLSSEEFVVDGRRVSMLNTRGASAHRLEEPRFWFHSPGAVSGSQWDAPRGPGVGFANSGNSCFMNAALQALSYCPPLAKDCLHYRHSRQCERRAADISCIYCVFERFVCRLFAHKGHYNAQRDRLVPPAALRDILGKDPHARYLQHDTHEALTVFLERLRRCDLPMACERDFERHAIANAELSTTYWNQLMSGVLEEHRTCLTCKRASSTFQPFWDLILSIDNRSTFEGALSKYFEPEYLGNGNEVWCDFCGTNQPKVVQRSIRQAPNVLTIVFQRVCHSSKGVKKLGHRICIPSEVDINPFRSCPGSAKTEAFGVAACNGVGKCGSFAVEEKNRLTEQRHMAARYDEQRRIDIEMCGMKTAPSCRLFFPSAGQTADASDPLGKTHNSEVTALGDRYQFFSAIAHSGSAMFGHYFAYCRAPDDRIYEIDDEFVSLANVVRGSYLSLSYSSVYLCMFVRVESVERPAATDVILYSSLSAADSGGARRLEKSQSNGGGADLPAARRQLDVAAALKAAATAVHAGSAGDDGIVAQVVVRNGKGGGELSIERGSNNHLSTRRREPSVDDVYNNSNTDGLLLPQSSNNSNTQIEETIRNPGTPPHRSASHFRGDMTPPIKTCAPMRRRGSFDAVQRMQNAGSMMSQFEGAEVGEWAAPECCEFNKTPFITEGVAKRLTPQRRSLAFVAAQSALQPPPVAKRSEHDREYDKGKMKKLRAMKSEQSSEVKTTTADDIFSLDWSHGSNAALNGIARRPDSASAAFDNAVRGKVAVVWRGSKRRRRMNELLRIENQRKRRRTENVL